MNNSLLLEKILFKPLVFKNDIVFVYSMETETQTDLGKDGNVARQNVDILYIVNVSNSLSEGYIVTDAWTVSDIDKFLDSIKEASIVEYGNAFLKLRELLIVDISNMTNKMSAYTKIANTLQKIIGNTREELNKDSNIFLGLPMIGLATIASNSITGDITKFDQEELNKIAKVIIDSITENISINTHDEVEINNLKESLELKILDVLPIDVSAGDIKLNMEFILEEINKAQNKNNGFGDN